MTVREGDPIIFIAGGPGGSHLGLRSFDPLADNHHQLIYFDAFGKGKSDTAKDEQNIHWSVILMTLRVYVRR